MKKTLIISMLICTSFFSFAKSPVKAIFMFKNYSESDMTVIIQVYDKRSKLTGNSSFSITKGIKKINSKEIEPVTTPVELDCFSGGIIKMKYLASGSGAEFTMNPVDVPRSRNNLVRSFDLNGFTNYSANNDKARFIEIGEQLNLVGVKSFTRLVDLIPQLGSLVVGKMIDKKLTNVDFIPITSVKYEFSSPSFIKESKLTEKSVMTDLSVNIPLYGSIASSMSNDEVHSVRYDISYYPYTNTTQISTVINSWDLEKKKALLATLKLLDKDLYVYILRKFDVLEEGTFSVTSGTKIKTDGNVSIAAVSTLSGSYVFDAQSSKSISIPSKGYNLEYDPWISVNDLIAKLSLATLLPVDSIKNVNLKIDSLILK